MFCSNCGAEILEGNNFCTQCGASIVNKETKPESKVSLTVIWNTEVKSKLPLQIQIDEKKYELQFGDQISIPLDSGKHRFSISTGIYIRNGIFNIKEDSAISVSVTSKSLYVLINKYQGNSFPEFELFQENEKYIKYSVFSMYLFSAFIILNLLGRIIGIFNDILGGYIILCDIFISIIVGIIILIQIISSAKSILHQKSTNYPSQALLPIIYLTFVFASSAYLIIKIIIQLAF